MRVIAALAWTCVASTTALRIPHGIRSKNKLVARQDSLDEIFPFAANQSSIVDASTEPTDNPDAEFLTSEAPVTTTGEIPRFFISPQCDDKWRKKLEGAWKEAQQLQQAQTVFNIGYNYDIPHTQWLGKDWNSESSWIPWRWNFRKLIGDNFGRIAKLFSKDAPAHEYIYWYCYDYDNQCDDFTFAYSWDSIGTFWSNHYTAFCDKFYNSDSLANQIEEVGSNTQAQKIMENFQYSTGQIMYHELWHYKDLVTKPRAGDYGYKPQGTWELARDKGTNYAYVNADSYAYDAVAIYVQQHFKSSMSPVPFRELSNLDPEAAAAESEPEDVEVTMLNFGDQGPPSFTAPTSADPDLDFWEEIDPESIGPPDTEPDAPENNKAVSIIMEQDDSGSRWLFYENEQGKPAGCNTDYVSVFKGPDFSGNIDDPGLPGGEYSFKIWGRECKWSGNGGNPGELVCDGDRYGCQANAGDKDTVDCGDGKKEHEGVFCDFYSDGEASEPPAEEPEETGPGADSCPVSEYPGINDVNAIPEWQEQNVCKSVCANGAYGLCAIVDDNENPTTGFCQCTELPQQCVDDGRYTCWQPE